ncbi:MAG: four helix bundle protein [Cyclobacteriaceae bacterium]
MFLELAHTKPDVYQASQMLALDCYKISRQFPAEEKLSMAQQLRRAALSVHLNLAEGCSGKSKAERNRFFEIYRSSVIEMDACLEIALKLGYVSMKNLTPLGESIIKTFKLLFGMINR